MVKNQRTVPQHDLPRFRIVVQFLDGRLDERATVEWALRLKSSDTTDRQALLYLLDSPTGRQLSEPWRSAWRLIEESWEEAFDRQAASLAVYDIQHRIKAGERSGAVVGAIAALVKPVVRTELLSRIDFTFRRVPARPQSVADLLSARLDSPDILDPSKISLGQIEDEPFLVELANELDATVVRGLGIARRLGWDGETGLWRLGDLRRVYFVPKAERPPGEHEPDEFHHGIAPSVKLLHAVIVRLIDVNAQAGAVFLHRLRGMKTPIHARLWAAVACDPRVAPSEMVEGFFIDSSDRYFWSLNEFPEIAELRARRFSDLSNTAQIALANRLVKGPPTHHWPKGLDRAAVAEARRYWAARELRRIQLAGGSLPARAQRWLATNLKDLDQLKGMSRLDDGFLGTMEARFVAPNPDERLDLLVGIRRLEALEGALSTGRRGWNDDPGGRASDWIRKSGNAELLIADFEMAQRGGAAFPRAWEQFGWSHAPASNEANINESHPAVRVLALLTKLPSETARSAIEGISAWLDSWANHLHGLKQFSRAWLRLWPEAAAATNAHQPAGTNASLSIIVQESSREREPEDLDTLNTPAGRLVGAFLSSCPAIKKGDRPFKDETLRSMRDLAAKSTGRSGLIARYRMTESLSWFLNADPTWTKSILVEPLLRNSDEAPILWRAFARRDQSLDSLEILEEAAVHRVLDPGTGRDTRKALISLVLYDTLHSFVGKKPSAAKIALIQQMLRALDDEARAHAAGIPQQYVNTTSGRVAQVTQRPEFVFRHSVRPFLEEVWPQERSLSTPGVSRAFADLPAASGDAFAEAVEAIERFLVPFDCWSMIDYGLYGSEDNEPKLSMVDDSTKAEALLHLLDATIGNAEDSVIPSDLDEALEQIRKVSPASQEKPVFRRLEVLTRR